MVRDEFFVERKFSGIIPNELADLLRAWKRFLSTEIYVEVTYMKEHLRTPQESQAGFETAIDCIHQPMAVFAFH